MYNLNRITKILGATFVLVSSSSVMAEETVDTTATVTVLNAFTFAKVDDLSFGTIRVSNSATANETASLNFLASESSTSTSNGNAVIQTLVAGTAATYTIAGVTAFTPMTVSFPTTATAVTPVSGAPGIAEFTIPGGLDDDGDFTNGGWSMAVDGTLVVGTGATGTGIVTSDTNGDAGFEVGAQLVTVQHATNTYNDESYVGTFTLTVDY